MSKCEAHSQPGDDDSRLDSTARVIQHVGFIQHTYILSYSMSQIKPDQRSGYNRITLQKSEVLYFPPWHSAAEAQSLGPMSVVLFRRQSSIQITHHKMSHRTTRVW